MYVSIDQGLELLPEALVDCVDHWARYRDGSSRNACCTDCGCDSFYFSQIRIGETMLLALSRCAANDNQKSGRILQA